MDWNACWHFDRGHGRLRPLRWKTLTLEMKKRPDWCMKGQAKDEYHELYEGGSDARWEVGRMDGRLDWVVDGQAMDGLGI